MPKRTLLALLLGTGLVLALSWTAAQAASRTVTGLLGGKPGDVFTLQGRLLVSALRVSGGAAILGSISNPVKRKGVDQPVVVADDLRVDGTIHRGAKAGPGDNQPLKFNDDVTITGNLTVEPGRTLTLTNTTVTGLTAAHLPDPVRTLEFSLNTFNSISGTTPSPLTSSTQPNLVLTAQQGVLAEYERTETREMGVQFRVPDDYVSGGVFKALVDLSGQIVVDYDVDFRVFISQGTGTTAWDPDSDNEGPVDVKNTPGQPQVVTFVPADQADLSAGDTVYFGLNPANNDATGEPRLEIYNVWFEYTASQ